MAAGVIHFFTNQNPDGYLGFIWDMRKNETKDIPANGLAISTKTYIERQVMSQCHNHVTSVVHFN